MPQNQISRVMKISVSGATSKSMSVGKYPKGRGTARIPKAKAKNLPIGKGQGKLGIRKGSKGDGHKSKDVAPSQRVSPVHRKDQPAFQTNLADKTSRKQLPDAPPGSSAKRTRSIPVAMPRAGMPVPPPKFFGNPDRMRMHDMKSSPVNLEAGNFDVHKRTVMIKGRPVQCLQRSHQAARSFELDGYLPFLMRPVPVQALMGYSAFDKDKPPNSHPYEVVVNWWQVIVFLVCLVIAAWF